MRDMGKMEHFQLKSIRILVFFLVAVPLFGETPESCLDPLRKANEKQQTKSFWKERVFDPLLVKSLKLALRSRYRIKVEGLEKIDPKGGGILIYPNHPGYTDPLLQFTTLFSKFKPRTVVYEGELNRPGIGELIKSTGALAVPEPKDHSEAELERSIEEMTDAVAAGLARGENFLVWPEGALSRGLPNVEGKSFFDRILEKKPDVRIVLSQTNGHMGSSFGWGATGQAPDLARVAVKRMIDLVKGGFFFLPKRPLTLKYEEVKDFPRNGTRTEMVEYLNRFYREGLKPNTYVPYRNSEPSDLIALPYPIMSTANFNDDGRPIDHAISSQVIKYLQEELKTTREFKETDDLQKDLEMDSLGTQALNVWLESTFQVKNEGPLNTVREVMLVASGKLARPSFPVAPPDGRYLSALKNAQGLPLRFPEGASTLWEAIRHQMGQHPDKVIMIDQNLGAITYRDLAVAVQLYVPLIKKMEGDRIGCLFPASAAGVIADVAILAAGKVPVEINFTAQDRNVDYSLKSAGVRTVLTAGPVLQKLKEKGIDLPSIQDKTVLMDEIMKKIDQRTILLTLLKSELPGFHRELPTPPADPKNLSTILFTSGSKSFPKTVGYSNELEISGIKDILHATQATDRESLLVVAPPFHSLGRRIMTTALTTGIPMVLYGDPTDGASIAKISKMNKPTVGVMTPTFLAGIARSAERGDLDSFRAMIVGAETLTKNVIDAFNEKMVDGNPVVLEGFGLTETSPVLFLNPMDRPKMGSIGKPVDSVETILVDPALLELDGKDLPKHVVPYGEGQNGLCLARAKDPKRSNIIFDGYLNYEGKQPFMELNGQRWFVTGDLMRRDGDGYYYFVSRLERSIKIGGEMVPLDGLESIFLQHPIFKLTNTDKGAKTLAVVDAPSRVNPELVLFTTRDFTVEEANQMIRAAGTVRVAKISRVVKVPQIPELGTGKTDYKPLKAMLGK